MARTLSTLLTTAVLSVAAPALVFAQESSPPGGEASLVLPDLSHAMFFGGSISGRTLLLYGLLVVALGLLFGLVIFRQLKNAPAYLDA